MFSENLWLIEVNKKILDCQLLYFQKLAMWNMFGPFDTLTPSVVSFHTSSSLIANTQYTNTQQHPNSVSLHLFVHLFFSFYSVFHSSYSLCHFPNFTSFALSFPPRFFTLVVAVPVEAAQCFLVTLTTQKEGMRLWSAS